MVRRWTIAAPGLLLLALLLAVALQVLRAEARLAAADREIRSWRSVPTTQTWTAVHDALLESAAMLPLTSAPAHELLGHLGLRRTDDAARMRASVRHFVRALHLRPVSPYAWAGLAEAKYQLGELDSVFEAAILNAAALGPAEPGVQRVVASYGLAAWGELSEPARAAVEKLLAAGVRREPGEMLRLAMRRGRLQSACRYLMEARREADARWLQLCRGTEVP